MAYTPHEWESGEVLTPAKLNTLTTAIGEMDMSYTPKTWHDGDILSAAEMNRIENAVASGGGGGSSDVTEAVITFVNNTMDLPYATVYFNDFSTGEEYITGFYTDDEIGVLTDMEGSSIGLQGTITQKVYILDNMAVSVIITNSGGDTITVSGNATYLGEHDQMAGIVVTGDCTITIS